MGVTLTSITGGSNAVAVVLESPVQIDSFLPSVAAVGSDDVWGRGRRRCGTSTSGPPPPPPPVPAADCTRAPQPVSARELEITGSPDGGGNG